MPLNFLLKLRVALFMAETNEFELGDCIVVKVTHYHNDREAEFYFATSVAEVRRSFDESRIRYASIDRVVLAEVPKEGTFYEAGLDWAKEQNRNNEGSFRVSTSQNQQFIDSVTNRIRWQRY